LEDRSVGWKVGSLVAVVVLALSVVGMFLRGALFARNIVGIAVQVAAVLLMVWARLTFGMRSFHAGANPTAGGLVTSGPYRFLRHPIYAAILYFVWAGVLTHLGLTNLLLAGIATAATAVRIVAEERLLVASYPDYRDYASRTRRVVPFVL
jgi:protein-S-isoprenylcysteine O-methyltransferase Ste14